MYNFTVDIQVSDQDIAKLKKLKFFEKDNIKSKISRQRNDTHDSFLDSLICKGLIRFTVTSLGYEEGAYGLTDIGQQIYKDVI